MSLKKLLIIATFLLIAMGQLQPISAETTTNPKNIIFFIGDGMGPSHVKAYRMFKDDPKTERVETLLFDSMLVGSLRTDPKMSVEQGADFSAPSKHQANGLVTDSAAAATAYATGFKTTNGRISVDVNNRPLPTVLEKAKHLGLSTGLVATSSITGATPAVFATHIKNRRKDKKIADQYIDNLYKGSPYVDVMLGGGAKYFIRNGRNLTEEFEAIGYTFVDNKKDLLNVDSKKVLGLFAENGLDKMLDRDKNTPSLADMTRVAIKQLSKNDKGFFLVVEGSQIDWAAHRQDIVGVMSEMQDFEDAIAVGLDFAKNSETQIIMTADHATGGLSVGAHIKGESLYQWNSRFISSFTATPEKIIEEALKSDDLLAEIQKYSGLELTKKELRKLSDVEPDEHKKALAFINELINKRSRTGWTTHGHTGVDVNLYAFGPASEQLYGHWDNTKIGKFIFKLLDEL